MNTDYRIHGIWFAAVLLAFSAGWYVSGSREAADDTATVEVVAASGRAVAIPAQSLESGGGTTRVDPATGGNPLQKSGALSEEDIKSLGEIFRTSTNPVERRLAFARLLQGLTAENGPLIREQITHLSDRNDMFRDFHYAWGAVGGWQAVAHGAGTGEIDVGVTLAGWANAHPDEAMAWFESLETRNDPALAQLLQQNKLSMQDFRANMLGGMVQGLADRDPVAATRFVMELGAAGDPRSGDLADYLAERVIERQGAVAAASWAQTLPAGPVRAEALTEVARSYARQDPSSTVQWLQGLPAAEDKTNGLRTAFSYWARTNADEAAQHLNRMNPSPERDWAVSGFAPRVAYQDPVSAIEWANSINDPGLREEALIQASRVYYHRVDREAAAAWLPQSGLSEEAQQAVIRGRG